mgnify:CR=1 FL=1
MANNWKRRTSEEIREIVRKALDQNVDFREGKFLGVPASHLDENVFYSDAPFLRDAPYMSTMVSNPNNIGCHTMGESESFFEGTQNIERELIKICAEDILKGKEDEQDGYVASGGTEANVQAAWIYRNLFIKEHGAQHNEIGLLCSADTHYAVYKAVNLLNIKIYTVPVDDETRKIKPSELDRVLKEAQNEGIQNFVVFANMATTMFGSVDEVNPYVQALKKHNFRYKIHADGAFGGFIYPFSASASELTFQNPEITSFTLDAHKMVQAPYGTGIFLIRKGYMDYAVTEEAKYVQGQDITLIGSRSGANAVAVWMILSNYGPYGWKERIHTLLYRTNILCQKLDEYGITYYRHPDLNIVTMHAGQFPVEMAKEFNLVPDNHHNPKWFKIVVMTHVSLDVLMEFTEAVKSNVKT